MIEVATGQENIPVLVGAGQLTDRRPPEEVATPIELMAEALRKASVDAGPGASLLREADVLIARHAEFIRKAIMLRETAGMRSSDDGK